MDLQLFEFQRLPIPESRRRFSNWVLFGIDEIETDSEGAEKEGYLCSACCGEDFWSEVVEMEETKIVAMAQKVNQFASYIVGPNGMTKNRPKKAVTPQEKNLSNLNKALGSIIPQILPASYHDSPLYDR